MQIIRRDTDDTDQKSFRRLGGHFKSSVIKHKKSYFVIMLTIVYLLLIPFATDVWTTVDQSAQSVGMTPVDMRELTDETVDTFALVYNKKILQNDDYMLTMGSRNNIKNLLLGLGADNIAKLNGAIYSGNTEKIVDTIIHLVDENFGWEEMALMKQWQ